MNDSTRISIGDVKINIIGRECTFSLSQTIQNRKNVSNKKTQGFGENNADGVVFLQHKSMIDDSDMIDYDSFFNRYY